jgi:hypothetical protein
MNILDSMLSFAILDVSPPLQCNVVNSHSHLQQQLLYCTLITIYLCISAKSKTNCSNITVLLRMTHSLYLHL